MTKRAKVLLIGWDAADWKVINPLLDAGLMPNLEKMINGGTIGNLATMDPAYSPMLWSSIATGKHAYKHGVLGFIEPTPDGKTVRPVMSVSRKVKAIWNILSEKKYKTHVIGWWPSHPAEPVNGISISNFYQKDIGRLRDPWPMSDGTVYPASESKRFEALRVHPEELTGQHILPFIPLAEKIDQSKDGNLYNVAKVTAHASSIQAAATNILRTEDWDFTAVYFDAIDHYCHGFMKYHPPKREHIPQHEFDLYNQVVTGGYRYHDMLLGRLLELAGEETTVMLISDHGFQPDHLRPKYRPQEMAGAAYEHSPYGIICVKGPGIKKDNLIHGGELLDITPTLLQIFGLPVGEDMDGRVLAEIFENEITESYIPSWENGTFKNLPDEVKHSDEAYEAMIQQLVDLGYINPADPDKERNLKMISDDCQFNLARSYMQADKILEAIEVLEPLAESNMQVPRFTFFLATAYQALGRHADCRRMIQRLRALEFYKPFALDIMEASVLIGEKNFRKALVLLDGLEEKYADNHARFHLKRAQCLLSLGYLDKAQLAINRELENDYDLALAHQVQGIIYLKKDQFADCCQSMLRAISLDYRLELAHFFLGRALFNLGDYENAAEAYETTLSMMPDNNLARNQLIKIYQTHLDQPEKAAKHRSNVDKYMRDEIIIVSGLPRSGTSLMMQMLAAGGVTLFTDGKRVADESNPKGYYEHELVKSLKTKKHWLIDAEGKAIKIVTSHLNSLPANRRYKVIFMDRDIDEIMTSQNKMLKRLGKKVNSKNQEQLKGSLLNNRVQAVKWLKSQPNFEVLIVNYAETIKSPFEHGLKVAEFLNMDLVIEKMIATIDPKLYREKSKTQLTKIM